MTGCCRNLAAIPEFLLSLSLLPRSHRHRSIVRSKHFQYHMFLEFRHGLLSNSILDSLQRKVQALANVTGGLSAENLYRVCGRLIADRGRLGDREMFVYHEGFCFPES